MLDIIIYDFVQINNYSACRQERECGDYYLLCRIVFLGGYCMKM